MAIFLGSFANGLFSGAQSAASLYQAYQGIQQTDAEMKQADEYRKYVEERYAKSQQSTADRTPLDYQQPGAQPGGPPAALPAPAAAPGAPGAAPATPPVNVQKIAATGTPAGVTPVQPIWDPNNKIGTESLTSPGRPALGPAPVSTPAPAISPPASLAPAETAGLPVLPPPDYSRPALTSSVPPAAPVIAPIIQKAIERFGSPAQQPYTGPPVPAGINIPTYTPPPATPPPPLASAPPMPGRPAVAPASTAPFPPGAGYQSPVAPPTSGPYGPMPTPPAAEQGAGPPKPVSQAAPAPGIGAQALHVLGSVFGAPAAAAETLGHGGSPPPGGPATAAPAPAPGTPPVDQTAADAAASDAARRNAGELPPAAPALAPAKPPTTKAPETAAPGPAAGSVVPPVATPAKEGPPAEQTQQTPVGLAPPLDYTAARDFRRLQPERAKMGQEIVDQFGGGAVSFDDLAVVYKRENGFQDTVADQPGSNGAQGLPQIQPATWQDFLKTIDDPNEKAAYAKLDPHNERDGMIMAVSLLKDYAIRAGLGSHSVQTHLAYRSGLGYVQQVAHGNLADYENRPEFLDIHKAFPDAKFTQAMFTGGVYNKDYKPTSLSTIVDAAHSGDPGKFLYAISTEGPPGLGMTDRMRYFQGMAEANAMMRGRYDMLPQIQDWFAMQSHAGALSHMGEADQALLSNNPQLAANLLAKAYAFVPDGAYGKFSVDDKGRVWGEQFSEGSNIPLGKPMRITHEGLMSEMIRLQNPQKYATHIQDYQLKNAQTEKEYAEAGYYKQLPGIKTDIAQQRYEAQTYATDQRAQTAANELARKRDADALRGTVEHGNVAPYITAVNKTVDEQYPPELKNPYKDVADADFEKMPAIQKMLMSPERVGNVQVGGAELPQRSATDLTHKLLAKPPGGAARYQVLPSKDDPNVDMVVDGEGKEQARISHEYGERMRHMLGAEPIKTAPGGGREQHSAVGAGIGTPTAMMAGYNQNLSGRPITPMQPMQPQRGLQTVSQMA